jgi:hypothetical protein
MTVTTDATLGGSSNPIDRLVDGGNSGPWWNAGQSGRHVTFQFPDARLITEAKWFQDVAASHGTWEWQVSDNGSSWSAISAGFTLDGSVSGTMMGDLSGNATPYALYRMQQMSGATSSAPFLREVEFKIRSG